MFKELKHANIDTEKINKMLCSMRLTTGFRLGALRCMTSHVTGISAAHCELRTRQRQTRNIPEPGNYSVPHLNIVVGWSGPWTAPYFWLIATSGPASQPMSDVVHLPHAPNLHFCYAKRYLSFKERAQNQRETRRIW